MTNYKLHNDCKIISQNTYNETKQQNINGWRYSKSVIGRNGFYADVYRKDNEIIIAVRGTDIGKGISELYDDLKEDSKMAVLNKLPAQVNYAREIYREYKKNNPDAKIILTGHSLGGSIMQALGSETGAETVTFGAYGIADTYSKNFKYTDNITNYGNNRDPVFISNINHHLGKTIVLNINSNKTDITLGISRPSLSSHFIENIGDLSKGAEYKPEFLNQNSTPLFKASIEYNDYNEDVFNINNRIFHTDEIDLANTDKDTLDAYINQYYSSDSMPTKVDLDARAYFGDLIYVEDYTRSDGTKVSGYYRHCSR